MNDSWVTIICLCHNQASFVDAALQSVLDQTHPFVELIIVDDGSTDGSKERITKFLETHPEVPFINHNTALGNCTAFNTGWRISKGKFVIDLAADDILLPNRIQVGLERMVETGAGVHFSDAYLIDSQDRIISKHNDRFNEPIPEGDVYAELVGRYWICPPTMMIKSEVLEALGGYDESLAYEDFDFWVRSAREFTYAFSDEVLVKKRLLSKSHGNTQNKFLNKHQATTLSVCKKIVALNRTEEDRKALRKRCWYEIRRCIKKGNLGLIPDYLSILKQC